MSVYDSEIGVFKSKIVIFQSKIYFFCQKFRLFRVRIVFGNTESILIEHDCIGLELFEDFFGIFWDWDGFWDFVGFGRKSLLLRFALSNSKSSNISFKWVERNKRPSRNHFSSLFFDHLFFDQFSHFWQLTIIFSVKVWLKPKSF